MMKIYTVAFFGHRYIDNILMAKERLRIKSKSFCKNMSTLIFGLGTMVTSTNTFL